MSKPVLGYWDFRGLAQDIRLLLNYVNVDFEDKRYPPGANFNDDFWTNEKFELGLDFPNLPYFLNDDGTKLTESRAILKYIAGLKCPSLIPATVHLQAKADMLEGVLTGLQRTLVAFLYSKDDPEPVELIDSKFQQLNGFIGHSEFSLGDKLHYIDFHLYEVLYQFFKYNPALRVKFPTLEKFKNNFETIPQLESYIKSPKVSQDICFSRKGRLVFN